LYVIFSVAKMRKTADVRVNAIGTTKDFVFKTPSIQTHGQNGNVSCRVLNVVKGQKLRPASAVIYRSE
jgi:hypothetical protein